MPESEIRQLAESLHKSPKQEPDNRSFLKRLLASLKITPLVNKRTLKIHGISIEGSAKF